MQWDGSEVAGSPIFGESTTVTADGVQLLPTGFQMTEPATLTRIIGSLTGAMVGAQAGVGSAVNLNFGIIVVSDNAFNAGIASVPDPRVDVEEDWVMWQRFNLAATNATPAGDPTSGLILPLDLRSQRKLKPGEVICGVLGVDSITAGDEVRAALLARLLFKLS